MKRFLTITQEAAFGTYNGAGTAINIRLSSAGAFSPMEKPDFYTVMDGSGLGVQVLAGSQTVTLAGTLTTELTYSQAAFLLGWSCTRINAGQTLPWVTTELPNDLPSCTIDYARSYMDNAAFHTKRYLGCKVASLGLSGSKDSPKLMATIGIVASTVQGNQFDASSDPVITAPALTTYPTDLAVFQQCRGTVTIRNVSRSNFDSFNLTLTNKVKPYWDESRYANAIRLGGRSFTVSSRFRKKSTIDDWTPLFGVTSQIATTSWVFTGGAGGAHTITFGANAQSYISSLDEESPIDEEHYYTLSIMNQLDQSAAGDFTMVVT
jgi:Phage tail tube protein